MVRVNAFFLLAALAISSTGFGAVLMCGIDNSETQNNYCRKLVSKQQVELDHIAAKQFYKQAFIAAFDEDWSTAESSSLRAAELETGGQKWHIEARDLIN